jgi:hypothetical protein
MKFEIENPRSIEMLNELFIKVESDLPDSIENSVMYPKLKQLIQREIMSFAKEQIGIRDDLIIIKDKIGDPMKFADIRKMMDDLSEKYNNDNNNVGVVYHIEPTRVDYGVPVHIIIRRGDKIHVKKFVFRFRKGGIRQGTDSLTQSGLSKSSPSKGENLVNKLLGGKKND